MPLIKKRNVFMCNSLMRLYFDKICIWPELAKSFNFRVPEFSNWPSDNSIYLLSYHKPFPYKYTKHLDYQIQLANQWVEPRNLFGYEEFEYPDGFYILTDNAVSKSYALTREIVSDNRNRKMIQVFDELSHTLCKVADIAQFVRIRYPKKKSRVAAEDASVIISTLVEELNTNRDLYDKLKYIIENGDICPTDDIDNFVAKLILLDFEQCGTHLEKGKRQQVVSYNKYIMQVGFRLMAQTESFRTVPKYQMSRTIMNDFPTDGEKVNRFYCYFYNENEDEREAAYKMFFHTEKSQLSLLDELLKKRQKLAKLCGFPSYAHRAVRGSIAGTPEFVHEFLKLLSDKIKPKAEEDYKKLLKLKQEQNRHATSLMPWDVDYYMKKFKEKEFLDQFKDYVEEEPYLSLGVCMDGLNHIFNVLYNVNLSIEETEEGELWRKEVRKLKVSEGDEILGYIYCDFFKHERNPEPLCKARRHYVIQGGRDPNDGKYEKPIVVLMLNLPEPSWPFPCLLRHSLVEKLFHEMGHAMHLMLARTKYKHVAFTRCSIDLAEIPSVLMEYFASDPRVITKFARHCDTGEVIPKHAVDQLLRAKRNFSACEMELDIFKAAFDQACHNNQYLDMPTTELLARVKKLYYSLPHVPDTIPERGQLKFSYLVSYGAKYYSYLVSRAVASWIWHKYFKDNPFSFESGKKFRNEILACSSSRPPRELVENFLGTDLTPANLSDALMKDITCKYV